MVSIVMTVSMMPSMAYAAPAKDVAGHWAEGTIVRWQEEGFISGYKDGSFLPEKPITRAEFIHLLNQTITSPEGSSVSFNDVSEKDWFYKDVAAAVNKGYTKGFENNTFRPNDYITRGQAAVFVANANGYTLNPSAAEKLKDYAKIPTWAAGSVGAMLDAGLMSGYPDGSFQVNRVMTRAEAVSTLDRVMNAAIILETDENQVEKEDAVTVSGVSNIHFTTADGDGNLEFTKPVDATGIIGYEVAFSKDGGANWENLFNIGVDDDAYIPVGQILVNVSQTTSYNKVRVISCVGEDGNYAEKYVDADLDYTFTIAGEAVKFQVAKGADNEYTLTLSKEPTAGDLYAVEVTKAQNAPEYYPYGFTYSPDNAQLSVVGEKDTPIVDGSVFTVQKVTNITAKGLTATPKK